MKELSIEFIKKKVESVQNGLLVSLMDKIDNNQNTILVEFADKYLEIENELEMTKEELNLEQTKSKDLI